VNYRDLSNRSFLSNNRFYIFRMYVYLTEVFNNANKNVMVNIRCSMIYSFAFLGIEFLDPFAVCVMLEVFHGLKGVKQEPWKETIPHATKAAKRSQIGTH